MADAWVVNASPLIALAHAGQLELLERLPDELVVPEAVVEEILAGPDDPARPPRACIGRGPRRAATVPEKVAEWSLGEGESAVLALALELGSIAVLDDRNARRCARALGVSVIGTFGVIVRAKQRGVIAAAQPVIRSVVHAGLYYDDDAIRTLLSASANAGRDASCAEAEGDARLGPARRSPETRASDATIPGCRPGRRRPRTLRACGR